MIFLINWFIKTVHWVLVLPRTKCIYKYYNKNYEKIYSFAKLPEFLKGKLAGIIAGVIVDERDVGREIQPMYTNTKIQGVNWKF